MGVCLCVFVHAQTGACRKDVQTFHIMFSQGNDEYKQGNPGTFPPSRPLV